MINETRVKTQTSRCTFLLFLVSRFLIMNVQQLACGFTIISIILPFTGRDLCSASFLEELPYSSLEVYKWMIIRKSAQKLGQLVCEVCVLEKKEKHVS